MDENEKRYVEVLEERSVESYVNYFEALKCRGSLPADDFKAIEMLSYRALGASYALAIIACPHCKPETKAWASELLHSAM